MAYVKKRTGSNGTKWDACWDVYKDEKRVERSKTFGTQKEAKAFLTRIGLQKPSSNDPLKKLTDAFLDDFESAVKKKDREESTLRQYQQHVRLHILKDAEFAALKCGDIGTPDAQAFLNRLYQRDDVSPAMAVKVRNTLSQIFSFGTRVGPFVSFNPVRETKLKTTTRPEAGEGGEKFVLPPKPDLKRLLEKACNYDNTGRAEAIVRVLMYALRASEMRGLPVRALSLDDAQPKLRVNQRANRKDEIGPVKSEKSRRDIPLGPETVKALKRWLEARPDEGEIVFANEAGNVQSYQNFWNRFWVPLMNHAGLVTAEPASKTVIRDVEEEGRGLSPSMRGAMKARTEGRAISPRMEAALVAAEARAEYKQPRFGLHMLRHVYASLQIEQGVQPKRLQKLMGHSTLKVTMDTYGHLWPNEEEDKLAANVEKLLA